MYEKFRNLILYLKACYILIFLMLPNGCIRRIFT